MKNHTSTHRVLSSANQQKSKNGLAQWSSTATFVCSIVFVFVLILDRPQILLWLVAGAGLVLAWIIFDRVRANQKAQKPAREQALDFYKLRSHGISGGQGLLDGVHLGHTSQVQSLFRSIDNHLLLASPSHPLGVELLLGPHGTGKTHLINQVGRILFGERNVIEFRFRDLDDDSFEEAFFEMLAKIKRSPYQLISLENVDEASVSMLEPFLEIFGQNYWNFPSQNERVSFSGCLFILTASVVPPEELQLEMKKREWLMNAQVLPDRLITHCSEIISWQAFSNEILAELVSREIIACWKHYEIQPSFISPQAIFDVLKEVRKHPKQGLHILPQMVRKKSAASLEKAIQLHAIGARLDLSADGSFSAGNFIFANQRKKPGMAS